LDFMSNAARAVLPAVDVTIKLADSLRELDGLYRARHRALIEDRAYLAPRPLGRLCDRFDGDPGTGNLIAVAGDEVIGGVRLSAYTDAGAPMDELFDLGPHVAPGPGQLWIGSAFFVDARHRGVRRLARTLVHAAFAFVRARRGRQIAAVISPDAEPILLATGFRPLVPRFFHTGLALHALPVLRDLDDDDAPSPFGRCYRIVGGALELTPFEENP
jgi:hypothetical protein